MTIDCIWLHDRLCRTVCYAMVRRVQIGDTGQKQPVTRQAADSSHQLGSIVAAKCFATQRATGATTPLPHILYRTLSLFVLPSARCNV